MSDSITWDDLDGMVEGDPLELRDYAWGAICERNAELMRLRPVLAAAEALVNHRNDAAAYLDDGWESKELILMGRLSAAVWEATP